MGEENDREVDVAKVWGEFRELGEEDLGTLLWEYEIVEHFSSRNRSLVKIVFFLHISSSIDQGQMFSKSSVALLLTQLMIP